MKIDKKFLEQLTGSLSKDKVERESKEFGNIFNIINKLNPNDNKIDLEEITKFSTSIWQEDDGDGKISDDEIESYIQKNQSEFKNTEIKAKDIKKFLEFFVKNSDKTPDNTRVDNGDGTYSVITQREEFEEQRIVRNQKEIDEWNARHNNNRNNNNIFGALNNNTKPSQTNSKQEKNEKKESVSSLFNEIGFSNKKKAEAKPDKRPEPNYSTRLVSKGVVSRKINYNSNNQITSIEETKGNVTTITDSNGKLLQTITKNEGAKDTIKDYKILEDGTREESIFYGDNGAKDSSNPEYKNVYINNKLVAKYEYDSNGQIVQRQNISDGTVVSVTKYNNGVEAETVKLFTNTNDYADPDKVFDNIIDPTKQNFTGECWLLNGLSMLSKKPWGRQAISDAITRDPATGNITVKFKHAYGDTKEFIITPQELAEAREETVKKYSFKLEKGDKVYIDGKLQLVMPKGEGFYFEASMVKENITFLSTNGKKNVWTKEELDNNDIGVLEGPKYSSGDLTVLAIEIAAERSRNEAGCRLDNGGWFTEVAAFFFDNEKYEHIRNTAVSSVSSSIETNAEKQEDKNRDTAVTKLTGRKEVYTSRYNYNQVIEKLNLIKENPDKYVCDLALKMSDTGLHAAQILRFQEKDGKTYITYTHPWNEKAEVTEELEEFCKTKLYSFEIIEKSNEEAEIEVSSDSQIGLFQMGNKSNRTNFASAIAILGQNSNFKPDIQKEGENFVVTIKGEKIKITPNELETARMSGSYSTKDDDIPLLEIAVERYINKTRHINTMYELAHTNLEDVKLQDILNLFSDKELKPQQSRSLAEASKKDGLKFAINQRSDESIGGMRNTYYPIKEIKQTPDGKYLISVIQPEDTSIIVTYTEEEYRKTFNIIETFS